MQQVYMYFRGSGKAAEMRQEAARGAMRAAFWSTKIIMFFYGLNWIFSRDCDFYVISIS